LCVKTHAKFKKKISPLLIILIEAIKVERNNTILNTKQTIFICLKGKKELPILQIRKPININELEKEASDLASFLQVPIKGI
jgi:hypothetical protein